MVLALLAGAREPERIEAAPRLAIRGTVKPARGDPAIGARVELWSTQYHPVAGTNMRLLAEKVVGPDGTFAFELERAGRQVHVRAHLAGYARAGVTCCLNSVRAADGRFIQQSPPELRLVLQGPQALRGCVSIGGTGAPVEEALVRIVRMGDGDNMAGIAMPEMAELCEMASDGTMMLQRLVPGSWWSTLSSSTGRQAFAVRETLEVPGQGVLEQTFVVGLNTIRGTLLDPTGVPLPTCRST
jgi:hypothetical protein